MSVLKYVLTFICGAGVGATGMYLYSKNKTNNYIDDRINAEVNAYRDILDKRYRGELNVDDTDDDSMKTYEAMEKAGKISKKPPLSNLYSKKLTDLGYVPYSDSEKKQVETEHPDDDDPDEAVDRDLEDNQIDISDDYNPRELHDHPYSIPPEGPTGFGMLENYDIVELYYTADGRVVDDPDAGDLVEDADFKVGEDIADHIGEFDDDVAYIRNDQLCIDYQILKTLNSYEEGILPGKEE